MGYSDADNFDTVTEISLRKSEPKPGGLRVVRFFYCPVFLFAGGAFLVEAKTVNFQP